MHLTNLAGPLDVFARASSSLVRSGVRKTPAYDIQLLTAGDTPLMTSSGIGLIGGRMWREAAKTHRYAADICQRSCNEIEP